METAEPHAAPLAQRPRSDVRKWGDCAFDRGRKQGLLHLDALGTFWAFTHSDSLRDRTFRSHDEGPDRAFRGYESPARDRKYFKGECACETD